MSVSAAKVRLLFTSILLVAAMMATASSLRVRSQVFTWPSFEIVYRLEGYGLGLNGGQGVQHYKLIYKSAENWEFEILSNSSVPDLIGRRYSYTKQGNNEAIRDFNPRTGRESTISRESEGTQIPDQWASPTYIAQLLTRPDAAVLDTVDHTAIASRVKLSPADLASFSLTQQRPCGEFDDQILHQLRSDGCNDSLSERIEITYSKVHQILLEKSYYLDNILIGKFIVENLVWQ